MNTTAEMPETPAAPNPGGGISREIRALRILLCGVVLIGAVSVLAPGVLDRLRMNSLVPQMMFGLAILALMLHLYLASQRKLLGETSSALAAVRAFATRVEEYSLLDPQTGLFNRRYLDQLFSQQMSWINRTGKPSTLLLFEVPLNGDRMSTEELLREAARILRSNFRGSDSIVRNSPNQFLALLPETSAEQAQFALNRLADKVDHWNLETKGSEMQLRHALSTCPPGGDLWENLRRTEQGLRNTSAVASFRKDSPTLLQGSKASVQ
jgi:diguanylate cyclase (GGDEF)-like protein